MYLIVIRAGPLLGGAPAPVTYSFPSRAERDRKLAQLRVLALWIYGSDEGVEGNDP